LGQNACDGYGRDSGRDAGPSHEDALCAYGAHQIPATFFPEKN